MEIWIYCIFYVLIRIDITYWGCDDDLNLKLKSMFNLRCHCDRHIVFVFCSEAFKKERLNKKKFSSEQW